MESQRERLTEVFYKWEHRGRGYKAWDERVILEPLFTPFFFHRAHLTTAKPDDGRVRSFESRVKALFSAGRNERDADEELPAIDVLDYPDETPDHILASYHEPRELLLTFPTGFSSSRATLELLLTSLSNASGPISFEFIGTGGSLATVITAPASVASKVQHQIEQLFPELLVSPAEEYLQTAWADLGERESLVVDLGLDQEFLASLDFTLAGTDPLGPLLIILDNLEHGETAVYQVIFEPVRAPWAQSMVRSVLTPDDEAFLGDQALVQQARAKVAHPLYGVVLRLAIKATNVERCYELGRALVGALGVFGGPASNKFIPLESDSIDPLEHQVDLIARMSHRSGMILNSNELLHVVHFPGPSLLLKNAVQVASNTSCTPADMADSGLLLGTNSHRGKITNVFLNDEERTRHMHVIGATGSGKSNLLLHSIVQDITNGHGVGVIDPHGDLVDRIIAQIPESRMDDVILVDPSDEDFPIGFNVLSAHSELERTLLASDLTSIFRRFATSWGDQMTAVLDNTILAVLNHPDGGTLRDIQRFLVEKEFRNAFLAGVTDDQVTYYWRNEFPLLTGRPQASILTRLSMFLRPKAIRHMVVQRENRIDLPRIMDSRKILLIKLSHGLIGEENAHLLGALIVSKINQTVMGRQATAESERAPFWLYIDEFHHFATGSVAAILSGARKYQLGLILAHQEMKQVEARDPELAEALLANPYTRVCFRLGDRDARRLSDGFAHFDASDLQNLGIGESICRFGRADYDFNLSTPLQDIAPEASKHKATVIRDRCRAQYATPRVEVEQLLRESHSAPSPKPDRQVTAKQSDAKTEQAAPKSEPATAHEETEDDGKATVDTTVADERSEVPIAVEPPAPTAEDTAAPAPSPPEADQPPDKPEGRGGPEHQSIQAQLKQLAEGFGYGASIEEEIGGRKAVDVSLKRGQTRIAIEVSLTTSTAHEVANIQKCLEAGYTEVIMTSPNPNTLSRIRRKAKTMIPHDDLDKVLFLSPKDISTHLVELEAQEAGGTEEIMGWQVDTHYTNAEKLSKTDRLAAETKFASLAQQLRGSRK